MNDAELSERVEALAHGVLAPLVLGGPVHPVRPFGAPLALQCGRERRIADGALAVQIDVARVRRARLVAPIDTLPELDESEWALVAVLNDILQITNHHLAGPLTRGRYARLAANVRWVCERVPPPRDVSQALARHATFARVLSIARKDQNVSWWTGTAEFRGEVPPSRLLAWQSIRRVRVDATHVPLADMSGGMSGLAPEEFADVLSLFLGRTPLTDLATATRASPVFAWSASTLSLISVPPGRALAIRALARLPLDSVIATLETAAKQVPPTLEEAKTLAEGLATSMRELAAFDAPPAEK